MIDDDIHTAELHHELVMSCNVSHPPDTVWDTIVDPGKFSLWWPFTVISMECTVGGLIIFADGDDTSYTGVITDFAAQEVVAFVEEDADQIRLQLQPTTGGALVTLTHRFRGGPPAERHAAGWYQCLTALRHVLDGAEPPPVQRDVGMEARFAHHFAVARC